MNVHITLHHNGNDTRDQGVDVEARDATRSISSFCRTYRLVLIFPPFPASPISSFVSRHRSLPTMSGFGSGSFGGFGQNNNNTQQTTFGGFGSTNNNTNTGFGATNNTATAFGSNTNTGGGLFGNNSNTSGGFGATSSGFGANNTNSAFGAKPAGAFGTTASSSGTGLFGSGNNASTGTTSFGGFGSNNTTANTGTSTGFGATGGGMFGGGTTNNNTGTGSLFGGGNTSGTTGFGGFGATNNPGIGGNASDPPGTNTTPFQAYQEKETTGTGNQSNSFQNILFQDPYKKWSAEELRLTDYAQGRRYGNASGTGAFGVSNFGGTGGFGATNNTTQQPTGFGSTPSAGSNLFGGGGANTTSAFGSGSTGTFGSTNTGGGLFGATNKPAATGGLFGGGAAQPAATGGLFGGSGTASTGFGSNTNTATSGFGSNTANTGGGLFGSTANNNQAKPGGFSFGNTATAPTNTGFGAGNTGSAFGSNNTPANTTGGGLFGGGNTGTTGGGLFGGGANNQQQQSASTGFGGGTGFGAQTQQSGGSLFGNTNQQKPAGGLFGGGAATNTGGGLFGNAGGNTTSGFGATNTAAGGGGLFGAQKPATGGTGLFGSAQPAQNTATTGGTGLFGGLGGNTQNQQTGQGGLFGGGAQNQAKPSLFGTSQSTGGGLFGSQNNQQQSSLFNSGQQQQQGSLLGGSLLGNSQNNNAPAQQSLTASISDLSAYGTPALFSNLNGNEVANPGPLATPLSSKTKTRRSSILPMYKLNPASSTRFVTPQKRGFGFSYSTYGSPSGSPSSVTSTPGSMNRSMLGSSLSRGLSKSVSSSSLRKSFTAEDSILAPGAFSASSGPRYYGNTGSVRKLVINKDMRSDLFATPTKEKPALDSINGSRKLSKRVSFDTSTMDASEDGDHDVATPRNAPTISNDLDARSTNGTKATAASSPADVDSSKGKELAIVHEEDAYAQTPQVATEGSDKVPGMYWMSPKQDVISSMNRMQRQKVANFTVGRDNIFGGIVVLETRSATVYPNAAKKPPVGKGLNVPATISLDQSWPRGRDKRPTIDQKRLNKHIERLKKIPDTTFVDYNSETGVWKFSVEHFTTYGLDYDEDETDADLVSGEQSQQQQAPAVATVAEHSSSSDDLVNPGEDDTFDFRRKRRALPGAFDQREGRLEDDEDDDVLRSTTNQSQPFFGEPPSAVGSPASVTAASTTDFIHLDIALDPRLTGPVAAPSPSPGWNSRDLELMHHFTISTCDTLTSREDMRHVWRVTVPQEGYKHSYVMHGMLAVAAVHKAQLVPSERQTYITLAAYHQSLGLEGFTPLMFDVNRDNWKPIFSFASIVVLYVYLLPARSESQRLLTPFPSILELFSFVRGIQSIMQKLVNYIPRTSFAPIIWSVWITDVDDPMNPHPPLENSCLPRDVYQALKRLESAFDSGMQPDFRDDYLKAIDELMKVTRLLAHAGVSVESGMVMFWPYVIPERIMLDIEALNPHALLLLSYYCVFLNILEGRYWYSRGWAKPLMADIDLQLSHHRELAELLKWPKEQIMVDRAPM
ncbi:Nucleoporin like protein [Verticillium longisporum]|nr:Nucleoporin like protein [Verticillium longisporum]